jgi:hypothetical protein
MGLREPPRTVIKSAIIPYDLAEGNGLCLWSWHVISLSCNMFGIAESGCEAALFILLCGIIHRRSLTACTMAFPNEIAGGGRVVSGVQDCSSTQCSIRKVVHYCSVTCGPKPPLARPHAQAQTASRASAACRTNAICWRSLHRLWFASN